MSDHAFMTITATPGDSAVTARYSPTTGMVVVTLGAGKMFLPVLDAADLVDAITAALNDYTASLLAVA